MITLKNIKTKRFSSNGNGYSTEEVDEFMKEMAETYEAVLIKNKELYTKAGVLVKQVEEYKNNEKLITDAIATSQKMANRITTETEEKISRDIANAENAAKRIVNKAKREADELNEASKAKSTRIIDKAKLDASEIVDNANEKASRTIKNAEQKADKMISEAKNEKAIYENEIAEFKNEFEIFKEKLALLYNKQLKNLNTLEMPKKIKSIRNTSTSKEKYDDILDSDDQLNYFAADMQEEQEKVNNNSKTENSISKKDTKKNSKDIKTKEIKENNSIDIKENEDTKAKHSKKDDVILNGDNIDNFLNNIELDEDDSSFSKTAKENKSLKPEQKNNKKTSQVNKSNVTDNGQKTKGTNVIKPANDKPEFNQEQILSNQNNESNPEIYTKQNTPNFNQSIKSNPNNGFVPKFEQNYQNNQNYNRKPMYENNQRSSNNLNPNYGVKNQPIFNQPFNGSYHDQNQNQYRNDYDTNLQNKKPTKEKISLVPPEDFDDNNRENKKGFFNKK